MSSWLRQQRVLENCIVIWLNSTMDPSHLDLHQSISQLQRIVSSIETFVDIDQCIDYLTDIECEKVFMIISGNFDIELVHTIHNIPRLHVIYVLNDQKMIDEHRIEGIPKVKGVFNDIESLCHILEQQVNQSDTELISISVIPASSSVDLNELDQSFMYSQLVKETLLQKEYTEKDKMEFIEFCLIQHVENEFVHKVIDEFEQNYKPSSAIWWYSRDTFIYRMLNKALRTQDIEIIIKMGFFIGDLHRQIEELYLKSKHRMQITEVFRGQGVSNADFDKINKNKDGLLSFNNFLSTTFDSEIARVRACSAQDDPDQTGIYFQIKIDPSISTTPFASIDEVSYYSDSEQEVLFSMHTIFRISHLQQMENRLWHVTLTLTSDEDEQLKNLRDFTRKEIEMQPEWAQLSTLMLKMEEFQKAEAICRTIEELTSTNDLATQLWCHNNIGHIMIEQGDQKRALLHLQKALKMKQQSLPSDHPSLVSTHTNIGLLYDSMGQYSTALLHYEKALEIQEKSDPSDLAKLATIHNNIGFLHHTMEKYPNALSHLQEALDLRQRFLPSIHPDLAMTHNNLAEVYTTRGEYALALAHFQKTFEIQQRSLPPHHRNMGTVYNNIGRLRLVMGHYSDALSNLEKALKIWQEVLPSGHHDLAIVQNNIGLSYYSMGNYSVALSYFNKALKIQQESLPEDHPSLAIIHNHIGSIHHLIGDNTTALQHLEKALTIQQKCFLTNHSELAKTHANLAVIYLSQSQHSIALLHMKKALAMQEKSLPPNHPDLASVHNNIGTLYQRLGEYSMALSHLHRAVEILQSSELFNDSDLAYSYHNLGTLYLRMEQFSTALSYLEQTLKIWQKSLPPNHPNLIACHMSLAATYWSLNRYGESFQHAFETLRISSCTPRSPNSQIITPEDELD